MRAGGMEAESFPMMRRAMSEGAARRAADPSADAYKPFKKHVILFLENDVLFACSQPGQSAHGHFIRSRSGTGHAPGI